MMNRVRLLSILTFMCIFLMPSNDASAFSLNLDSVAEWGKFPRFIVRTYRWGDKFFNGYDTTFVKSTGYKFNAKVTCQNWFDGYNFAMPNDIRIRMISDASTSLGAHLTYLAVSAGYDVNVSNIISGSKLSRKRFRFGFNCMLFAVEAYYMKNDVGTTIRRFGPKDGHAALDLPFNGIDNTTFGIDGYYFFNHKRYSEAASFNYSRVQKRSSGSLFSGLSFYKQQIDFDFSKIPDDLHQYIPDTWLDKHYRVNSYNYAVRFGYGYNWVFSPKWVLGVSESPVIGIRRGYINSNIKSTTLSLYNRLRFSVVWNSANKRFFFGTTGKLDLALINEKKTSFASGIVTVEAVFGVRFNIW